MMSRSLILISLTLMFILVACAPTTQPPSQTISVTYHRSGGITGADDTWQISADGKVSHQGQTAGTSQQLTAAQMADLAAAVRTANFMSLADSYVPQDTCCDRYLYEITVTSDGQSKTVQTIDASPTAPAELTHLVNTLNQLVSSAQ
jgi:hypothetical protein